jgi:hypothetical protein
MARPKRGKARRAGDDWATAYCATGEMPIDDEAALALLSLNDAALHELWLAHRDRVMRDWDLPGCRPYGWWAHDAPRLPIGTFRSAFYDGLLAEPRRVVSGGGCPRHERLAYAPAQLYGIWDWCGDPHAPPVFETQHAYLRRFGLLRPGERAASEPHPHPRVIEDSSLW